MSNLFLLSILLTPSQLAAADQTAEMEIVSIQASCRGRFSKGYSWLLEINSQGTAELTIEYGPPPGKKRVFVVGEKSMAELKSIIARQKFFGLPKEIGDRIVDGSTRTLLIQTSQQKKKILIHYISKRDATPKIRRAIAIFHSIRGLFDDELAVDLRPYDRQVLDAAKHD